MKYLHQDGFVTMIQENLKIAPENMPDILKTLISYKNETLNLFSNSDSIVPANQSLTYELHERFLNGTHLKNYLGYGSLLTFKVGIYKKEEYLHYDEKVSQGYIYVSLKSFHLCLSSVFYNSINGTYFERLVLQKIYFFYKTKLLLLFIY